jgi:hypothetical protein
VFQSFFGQSDMKAALEDMGFLYYLIMRRMFDVDPELQKKYTDSKNNFVVYIAIRRRPVQRGDKNMAVMPFNIGARRTAELRWGTREDGRYL